MLPSDELEEIDAPRRRKPWLGVIVVAFVMIGLGLTLRRAPTVEAPSFDLPRLDGTGTISDEDLEGRPVVVNFWASWCAPCRREAPALEAVWKRYRDRVYFLGVNVQDTPGPARHFVREFGIGFPVVTDYDDLLAGPLGIAAGLPQTFFLDAEGNLAGNRRGEGVGSSGGTTIFGAITEEELVREIEALLEAEGS